MPGLQSSPALYPIDQRKDIWVIRLQEVRATKVFRFEGQACEVTCYADKAFIVIVLGIQLKLSALFKHSKWWCTY